MNAYLLETAVSARLEGVSDYRVGGRSADRLLGAFYTASAATEAMARWAVRSAGDRFLEPSYGDGAFLRAVDRVARERGFTRIRQFGAELVPEPYASAVRARLLPAKDAFLGDFLALNPFEVDAVIGNPPYVRLRHLPSDQLVRAMHAATSVLGKPMDTSGSVWMPFVLHSLRFLRHGGRLALVLPYEITHVRYARPLWEKLGRSFENLRVVRVHERLFPDILQEVVILFADGYGGSTKTVRFQAFERASQFANPGDDALVALSLADIAAGERVFLEALLPRRTQSLLSSVLARSTSPVPDRCVFNIGYVAGDKDFFHPPDDIARQYGLSRKSLRPALTSSRQLKTVGLRTSNATCVPDHLYLPYLRNGSVSESESGYIALGQRKQIHKRYKCRIREPWYVVPGVRVPDVVLSVFAERPVLAVNDAGLVASNSLLCGYLRSGTAEDFAAAWYTSLTMLQCELRVHSLGGGVFVLVPGEVGNMRLPDCNATKSHLACVDRRLANGQIEAAYQCGDDGVLKMQLGLGSKEIDELRAAIQTLRHWRNSARSRFDLARQEDAR